MSRVEGYTVERTVRGKPKSVFIDLRRHAKFIPILEENGFEIEEPVKWTAKMKRAFAEEEFSALDISNLWGE